MNDQQWHQLNAIMGRVSRDVFLNLKTYQAMVQHWQPHINLVAPSTLADLWSRHILDSAQLFSFVKKKSKNDIKWLDLGSGGGFPGLVIAILMKERGQGCVTLVESNSKKAAFLRQVAAQLQLPTVILNKRIEANAHLIPTADIITARALAPLPKLCAMMAPYFSPHTVALIQKGRESAQEVEQACLLWHFSLKQHLSLIDPQSVILEITALNVLKRGG